MDPFRINIFWKAVEILKKKDINPSGIPSRMTEDLQPRTDSLRFIFLKKYNLEIMVRLAIPRKVIEITNLERRRSASFRQDPVSEA
ncbi:MAG: hypothetical protein IPL16_06850 [Ignavibacteria bacterium]|nr:hypothetical protein [Ignavibacteria bacterium]